MTRFTPAISVIMPARDEERFIEAAIASLWDGGVAEIEVIVADDGSTDRTGEIVDALARDEPRLRRLALPPGGVSRARNAGIRACRAPLVTFLDADDLSAPGRLARQRDMLARHGARMILGDLFLFEALDDDWQPLPGTRFNRLTGVSMTSALFTRDVFDDHGVCDESLVLGEDFDFLLRLLEGGEEIVRDPEIAVYYRRHDSNTTKVTPGSTAAMIRLLRRSLARRRAGGGALDLGALFAARHRADQAFGDNR